MSLASEHQRQFRWGDWPTVFAALPPLKGKAILDLGCGVGDLTAELAARGAQVIGFEASEELIREARARRLPMAEFRAGDLRENLDLDVQADGIWCSFAAAFFPVTQGALPLGQTPETRWLACRYRS